MSASERRFSGKDFDFSRFFPNLHPGMKKYLVIASLLLLAVPVFGRGGDNLKYDDQGWPIAVGRSYFGYRFFVEGSYGMAMLIGSEPFSISFDKQLRYFDVGTSHGYQLGKIFYFGAGVSYLQLDGENVDKNLPFRRITAFGDIRFTFGGGFSGFLDLRPGAAYLWGTKTVTLSTEFGIGFDIARWFQLGLYANLLPLNFKTDHTTQMDALLGLRASVSFGRGNRK